MLKKQLQAPALSMKISHSLTQLLCVFACLLFIAQASADDTFTQPINAQPLGNNAQLIKQRKLYKQASTAFKNHRFGAFKKLTAQLKDYSLYPYLEYKDLMRKPASLSSQQIQHFLQVNDDTVIGYRFRKKLINYYSRHKKWTALIDIYRPHYGVRAQCQYLNSLLQTNQQAIAFPKIKQLWLSAESRPDICDNVFEKWQAAGHKTPKIIWQRFKLTMATSNIRLARYLIKSMPEQDAKIAKIWVNAHRKPSLKTILALQNITHPDKANILLHSLKRLSRKDIMLAINTYQQLDKKNFDDLQNATLYRYFGLRLAREHMPNASLWLARIPESHIDNQVKEWIIRTAIRQGHWKQLLTGVENLSRHKQLEYRWQYWWAFANEKLGHTNDALGIYQYLATKRSYYGFLAADHLNLPYAFEEKALEITQLEIDDVFKRAEILRAHEFYFMGKTLAARREWRQLIQHINNKQKLVASKIAQHWKWHDRAIITMGKTRYRDDIELRFPLHLDKKVLAWSSHRKIDPEWIYAIIRRESAFMSDARSPVGAMGLMQLMPRTARHVARQLKMHYKGSRSLLTSNTNIQLGSSYLERMLNKLDSQQVLATAAYNAGPHRVEKWLPEHNEMTAARWIETIPFTETREYVSNVLAYMAIYQHRMDKQITRLSLRMPPVPAKAPATIITKDDVIPSPDKPSHTAQAQVTTSNGPT